MTLHPHRLIYTMVCCPRYITNEEDIIAQANDRIEFLLDTAEMRLREAALCGYVL